MTINWQFSDSDLAMVDTKNVEWKTAEAQKKAKAEAARIAAEQAEAQRKAFSIAAIMVLVDQLVLLAPVLILARMYHRQHKVAIASTTKTVMLCEPLVRRRYIEVNQATQLN